MSIYVLSLGILTLVFCHLSIVSLFHSFINNGNLLKNGARECDKIIKHFGMSKNKAMFF